MICYVAATWDANDSEATCLAAELSRAFESAAPDWKHGCSCPGFLALYMVDRGPNIDRVYTLPGGRGVVFGRLFSRDGRQHVPSDGQSPVHALDPGTAHHMTAREGRDLLVSFWGRYVAFLVRADTGLVRVLRDPSSGISCYYTKFMGITVYFNRIEDGLRFVPLRPTINYHYLKGHLLFDVTNGTETGLSEVECLLGGECATHFAGRSGKELWWTPTMFASMTPLESISHAIEETKRTLTSCVHAWAHCSDGILLRLSGGLDSSVILACLTDFPRPLRAICWNDYSSGSNSDERAFARLATSFTQFRLIEEPRNPAYSLSGLRALPLTVSPIFAIHDLNAARRFREFVESNSISTILSGSGGDELFCRATPLPVSVDYAFRHGINRKLLSIAIAESTTSHFSFWQIAQLVWKFGLKKQNWRALSAIPRDAFSLVTPQVVKDCCDDPTMWHPLLRSSAPLPPGSKFMAYAVLYQTTRHQAPKLYDSMPVVIDPIRSQPFVELSLRLPTYILRHRGRDRAIVRDAFSDKVPNEIIRRRSKGGVENYLDSLVSTNLSLLRELLLDGVLVREGILDRPRLESALSGRLSQVRFSPTQILSYACAEAWAQTWISTSTRPEPRPRTSVSDVQPSAACLHTTPQQQFGTA